MYGINSKSKTEFSQHSNDHDGKSAYLIHFSIAKLQNCKYETYSLSKTDCQVVNMKKVFLILAGSNQFCT